MPKFAEVVQGYWRKIGVKAEIVPSDLGVYRTLGAATADKAVAPQLVGQATTIAHSAVPMTPRQMLSALHTGQTFGTGGSVTNRGFPGLDELIDGSASEIDAAKRKDMIAKAVKQGAESYTILVAGFVPDMVAVGQSITIDFPKPSPLGLVPYAEIAKPKK